MAAVTSQQVVQPWGRAFGLLIGGAVFLVCVARGVGPLEIVLRTAIVTTVTGVVVRGMVVILRRLTPEEDDGMEF